jgi:hypothetical protein
VPNHIHGAGLPKKCLGTYFRKFAAPKWVFIAELNSFSWVGEMAGAQTGPPAATKRALAPMAWLRGFGYWKKM